MSGTPDALDSLQYVLAGAPLQSVVPVGKREIQAIATAGYQYFEQGLWDKARNVFSALSRLAPTSYLGWAGLGALALKAGNLKESLQALSKAVELKTNDPAVYTNLGEVILRMGKSKEAAILLNVALELDPLKRDPAANRARAMLEGIEDASRPAGEPGKT